MIVPPPPEGWVIIAHGHEVSEQRRDLLVYVNREWVPARVDDGIRGGSHCINVRTVDVRWNLDPEGRPWLASGRRMPVERLARRVRS